MKKILQKFLPIFFGIFLASCLPKEEQTIESPEIITLPEQYNTELDEEKKIQLARERRKEMYLIQQGDYMMAKQNPRWALSVYLEVLKKLPDDVLLHRKIAEAYFLLKDWKNAYTHFVHVPLAELSRENQQNMIFSLFYDENFVHHKHELLKFQFDEKEREFYTIIADCYDGIETCADKIFNYEWNEERVMALQKIVKDSWKVSPNFAYRNLLLAKQMYEYKMYRLAGMIASSVLAMQGNYQEAIKIRAFSLYELGKYEEAKELMLKYLHENSADMEVIIRLGEVYTYLEDYVSANIYLNNAILAGYSPKTILERRLAYNYAKLGDMVGMQKVMAYLLQESDVAEDDFAVGISLALSQNEENRAYAWAYQGVNKFPASKTLIPLYLETLRRMGKNSEAEKFIYNLSDTLVVLPIIQLEKAILLYEKWEYTAAKEIFQKLLTYADDADFVSESRAYLEKILEKEKEEELRKQQENSLSGIVSEQNPSFQGDDFWK